MSKVDASAGSFFNKNINNSATVNFRNLNYSLMVQTTTKSNTSQKLDNKHLVLLCGADRAMFEVGQEG